MAGLDTHSVITSMNAKVLTALFALVLALPAAAQLDRNPELKSRALAWTEFDGSYLVDVNSRADMIDFYWTVLARPYPSNGWSGSLNPQIPGETSELWRVREYSQLNAYRAMSQLPALRENAAILSGIQQGALVLGLNDRVSHDIDKTWLGYTDAARDILRDSNLVGPYTSGGVVDRFIFDDGSNNTLAVGHRANLLHPTATTASIGAARSSRTSSQFYATLSVSPFTTNTGIAAAMDFVAWPSPGYVPLALVRRPPSSAASGSGILRWSFRSNLSTFESDFTAAVVSAAVNGRPIPVKNKQYIRGWPITWEFDPADLNLATLQGDTDVEIQISGAVVRGQNTTFKYTVKLFDEAAIKPVAFAPQTPLVNISTRGLVGSGSNVMIAGFVVEGTLPVRVALRAQGPSLTRFGIQNTMQRPRLKLINSSNVSLGENAGWKQHQDWRMLSSYGVAPVEDIEPGMVITLWPGAYTAILSDDSGTSGVGIVEAFNIDNLTSARLMNLSTRGIVGSGENALIAGIIIKDKPRTLVIRTQGPSLARFGLDGVADTTLRLVGSGVEIVNDNWRDGAANTRLRGDLAGFAPLDDREAALVVTLQPGSYTALVEGKSGAAVGIVEVFDLN